MGPNENTAAAPSDDSQISESADDQQKDAASVDGARPSTEGELKPQAKESCVTGFFDLPCVRTEEELGSLLEASGAMSLSEFALISNATKDKISRCMALLEALPNEEFVAAKVKTIIQNHLKIIDFQRYLMMLVQGEFLSRTAIGVGRKMFYRKTETGQLSGPDLARAIYEANDKMVGYEHRGSDNPATRMTRQKTEMMRERIHELEHAVQSLTRQNSMLEKKLEQANIESVQFAGLSEEFLELVQKFEKTRELFPGMTLEMYLELWLKARKGGGGA